MIGQNRGALCYAVGFYLVVIMKSIFKTVWSFKEVMRIVAATV
jgi:hypothetical protein